MATYNGLYNASKWNFCLFYDEKKKLIRNDEKENTRSNFNYGHRFDFLFQFLRTIVP